MSVLERTLSGPAPPWRRASLRRIEWLLDDSQVSRSRSAMRVRLLVGALFCLYGTLLEFVALSKGDLQLRPLFFIVGALPILFNRLGRLGRYFVPVGLGLFAYSITATYALEFKLPVHYAPQIRADRFLGDGAVPSVWLQQHLYDGRTGALEAACVVAYLGHFLIPVALGVTLALRDRLEEFKFLMFSILAVAVLAAVVFVLAPTAPPWLAVERGHLSGVHHILRQSLADLHMRSLAAIEGDSRVYDVTAAVPSLHAAFPVICLITAIRARLPRAVVGLLALNVLWVVFAIVYLGEHYVADALAGIAVAGVAVLLVALALRPDRPGGVRPSIP